MRKHRRAGLCGACPDRPKRRRTGHVTADGCKRRSAAAIFFL